MLPIDDMPTMASEMISLPRLEDVETSVAELYNTLEGVIEFSQLGDADDPLVMDVCKCVCESYHQNKIQLLVGFDGRPGVPAPLPN
mmetsp:Transcript_45371/g.176293  ORF Transcript_45371/g.176293 Transcript_45371/m.176293 type:complete len:86 (-) Transcript_45371:1539-1796(-)